jgi:hypothetical protein
MLAPSGYLDRESFLDVAKVLLGETFRDEAMLKQHLFSKHYEPPTGRPSSTLASAAEHKERTKAVMHEYHRGFLGLGVKEASGGGHLRVSFRWWWPH